MADQANGLTQTEIANGLGRSIHEIYRILLLLEKRGYHRAHQCGPLPAVAEALRAGAQAPAGQPARRKRAAGDARACRQCRPELPSGGARRPATCWSCCRSIRRLPMRYSVALGSQFPMLETSSGAVLLAHLEPRGPRSSSSSASLPPAKDRIRARRSRRGSTRRRALGYEMRRSLAVEACTNISTAGARPYRRGDAALTVPFLPQKAARFDRETRFPATLRAAERISAALGAGGNIRRRSLSANPERRANRPELNHMDTGRRT